MCENSQVKVCMCVFECIRMSVNVCVCVRERGLMLELSERVNVCVIGRVIHKRKKRGRERQCE